MREIKTRDLNGVRYIKDEVREVMKASWHICSVHHIQARGWRDNNDIGRYATACLLKSSQIINAARVAKKLLGK